jgi:L-fucose isomerase
MLFGHLLTGTSQVFSDVRTYWSPAAIKRVTGYSPKGVVENGVIHLINSGSTTMDGTGQQKRDGKPVMKPFWEITPQEVTRCLEATRFCPADREYFRGGGFSTSFLTTGSMSVTMSRINMVAGLGPVLQVAEGHTVDLPKDVGKKLMDRTNPTWPTTWFVPNLTGYGPFKDVYSVMENWGANHGAISYGHIGGDLITLASMLRIPVSMHNVPAINIFRPKVWGAFGDFDSQGADYRACAKFGPLYSIK